MPRSNVMHLVQWEEWNPRTGLKMRQKPFWTHRAALSLREALECDGNVRAVILHTKAVVYRVESHGFAEREHGIVARRTYDDFVDAQAHAEAEIARGRGVYGIYCGAEGFGLMPPVKWQGLDD